MSGPKSASYTISAATAAALYAEAEAARAWAREQARLAALSAQWRALESRRQALACRADALRSRYQLTVPEIADLSDVTGLAADGLATQVSGWSATLAGLDQELRKQERDAFARDAVADLLASLGDTDPAEIRRPATSGRAAEALERDLAEADEILGLLDPEIGHPAQLTSLLDALPKEGPGRRRFLLRQLRADVKKLNAELREQRDRVVAHDEVRCVLTQTGDAELGALLDRPETTAAELRAAADAAAARYRAQREREYVQQVILDVFGQLNYAVVAGFEVHTPAEGVLVRRDSAATHGVQVRVRSGAVHVEAVRLGASAATGFTSADHRAQEELCGHVAPRLWDAMMRRGVAISAMTSTPVGQEVPKVVEVAALSVPEEIHRSRRPTARAQERRLP